MKQYASVNIPFGPTSIKHHWGIKGLMLFFLFLMATEPIAAQSRELEISSLEELVQVASKSGQHIRMKPGVYSLAEYLTDERLEKLLEEFEPRTESQKRPPRWLLRLDGNQNTFDLTGVTITIHTDLYSKLPYGYTRCIFIDGDGNTLRGLTIRSEGAMDQGSNGNTLSVFGNHTVLEEVSVYVGGSSPYGYGDLLGKGGPVLTGLKKQSGIMVTGEHNTLRACKVFSKAFGHCFYIQNQGKSARDIVLENCYAEGSVRSTNDMLAETEGVAYDLNFRSIYENRDGRYMITPGYTKSLSEDGFRTYGGVGHVTLRNCIAVNTRAGFEIGGTKDANDRTIMEGCQAMGTERAFLLGSNVLVRNCRGDIQYGPLLYLRENTVGADVELELLPSMPKTLVHAVATIAGEHHRVRLYTNDPDGKMPALPIMLGFGMPAHAEMSSPILSKMTDGVQLVNEISRLPVIKSDQATNLKVVSPGVEVWDERTREITKRGRW